MKSSPELFLEEQLRRGDTTSGPVEVNELVVLALEWKRISWPDPAFAARLERRL